MSIDLYRKAHATMVPSACCAATSILGTSLLSYEASAAICRHAPNTDARVASARRRRPFVSAAERMLRCRHRARRSWRHRARTAAEAPSSAA